MLFESPPECLAARTCQVLCNVGLQIMTQPVGTKEVYLHLQKQKLQTLGVPKRRSDNYQRRDKVCAR